MVLGVFAGLSARALEIHEWTSGEPAHHHAEDGSEVPCDGGHDDHHDQLPDDGQPCHDHHHHVCCGSLPISHEITGRVGIEPPDGRLMGIGESKLSIPDAPFLEEDAPPLI